MQRTATNPDTMQRPSIMPARVWTQDVYDLARRQGVRLATAVEAVMDGQLMMDMRDKRIFVSGENLPEAGKYLVDRRGLSIVRLTDEQFDLCNWSERLQVYPSTALSIRERLPLVLYIDFHGPCELGVGTGLNQETEWAASLPESMALLRTSR